MPALGLELLTQARAKDSTAMSPRQRMAAAVDGQPADQLPFDYQAVPELTARLITEFNLDCEETLLRLLGSDCRRLQPAYTGHRPERYADGSHVDAWGCLRRDVANETGSYSEYAGFPLAGQDVKGVQDYALWPDPAAWDWQALRAACRQATDYHTRVHLGGIFETAWGLYGLDNMLMDLHVQPEVPAAIMRRITDIHIARVRMLRDWLGDDLCIVGTYDDVATQRGPLMSVTMWREHVLPHHVRLNEAIRHCGYPVYYHCCGAIAAFVDGFVADMGISVLDPLQPRAEGMDFTSLEANYGDRVAFHGGIDLQETMPHGSPDDVRAELEHCRNTLGRHGRYICSGAHHFQADTPWWNIAALYSAKR
jgi:uroporphyrinogen decarboxylase